MQESQFWPGNAQYAMTEFGLAQVNDMGADVALRWDPDLYQQLCSTVLSRLQYALFASPGIVARHGSWGPLNSMNALVPDLQIWPECELAHTSIYMIARILHANCWDSGYVLSLNNVTAASYEDYLEAYIAFLP